MRSVYKLMAVVSLMAITMPALGNEVMNDPRLAKRMGIGTLKEGMICGVDCLTWRGLNYAAEGSKETDKQRRAIMDMGAWYNYVNAYRLLEYAKSAEVVSNARKAQVDERLEEIYNILQTIGFKGFGWSKSQIEAEYQKTSTYLNELADELIKDPK